MTIAYISPGDSEKKNREMRLQGLHAVLVMVEHVNRVWQGYQHVVVAHVNAPDGCQVLRTQLRDVVPMCQVAALPLFSELPVFTGLAGMCFSRLPNNEVFHQRMKIKSMGKATVQGRSFSRTWLVMVCYR